MGNVMIKATKSAAVYDSNAKGPKCTTCVSKTKLWNEVNIRRLKSVLLPPHAA
jgi:hypothetical protein